MIYHFSPRERRVAPRAAGGRSASEDKSHRRLRCFSEEVLGRDEAPAHVRSSQNGRSETPAAGGGRPLNDEAPRVAGRTSSERQAHCAAGTSDLPFEGLRYI